MRRGRARALPGSLERCNSPSCFFLHSCRVCGILSTGRARAGVAPSGRSRPVCAVIAAGLFCYGSFAKSSSIFCFASSRSRHPSSTWRIIRKNVANCRSVMPASFSILSPSCLATRSGPLLPPLTVIILYYNYTLFSTGISRIKPSQPVYYNAYTYKIYNPVPILNQIRHI